MKVKEFANQIRAEYKSYLYSTLCKICNVDKDIEPKKAVEQIAHFIEQLEGEPVCDEYNCIPYPLGMDGEPLKIGDKIYIGNCETPYYVFAVGRSRIFYHEEVSRISWAFAQACSHEKPRTLDDLKAEAYEFSLLNHEEDLAKLIQEAYELGKREI